MLAYAAGDAGAFDALYARHRGGVYRYLLRHVGNAGIADELFQDVWMNVIRARATYAPTAKFTTWLYTLAHHRLVDHWRSRGNVRVVSLDDEGDEGDRRAGRRDPGLARRRARDARRVAQPRASASTPRCARCLPAQREAFLLHIESEMSLAEIAELTGAGEETVKSRCATPTRSLRATLEDLV